MINLDGSEERLSQARLQLEIAGLPFERVSAFDGRGVDPLTIGDYDEAHALAYMGRKLTGGEIGCFLSHLKSVKQFLSSDASYALVLEDDMQINSNAAVIVNHFLHWLEQSKFEWYLINIGARKHKIVTNLTNYDGFDLLHAHYFPITTTGLIWSRTGAKAFLEKYDKIFCPIDNYFRWWLTDNNKGLCISPRLVIPSGAPSDIDVGLKRKNEGRSPFHGLIKQKRSWQGKAQAIRHKWFGSK